MQCLFNPGAAGEGNGIVSVVGAGIFKCFKTAENSLKLLTSALAKREPQNYMAHAWLSEGMCSHSQPRCLYCMCPTLVTKDAQPSSALPSPAQPSPAQPSPAQPSPAQPRGPAQCASMLHITNFPLHTRAAISNFRSWASDETLRALVHVAGERERVVMGTDMGELLIVEGTELKASLQLDPGSTVHSIAAYAKVKTITDHMIFIHYVA